MNNVENILADDPTNENRTGRRIRVMGSSDRNKRNDVSVRLALNCLDISVGEKSILERPKGDCCRVCCRNGYDVLKDLVTELKALQRERLWKFTLGQKTIGGKSPRTVSSLLAAGLLHGELLETLVTEFLKVIDDLQRLTTEAEADAMDEIQKDLVQIEETRQLEGEFLANELSSVTDSFCGNNITKNWHPEKGRFVRLREMGEHFRSRELILTPAEELPARHLGALLRAGSNLTDVYEADPANHTTFRPEIGWWQTLVEYAVVGVRSQAARRRIWNCGLSDSGIHNLFLSDDRLWLFDLGEPSLQSLPGFLTKFLFSFFHTLGMEDDGSGGWVNRFVPGDKLSLTKETEALLPMAYDAFETTLDRFSDELFNGDDTVRGLLISYVSSQLFSDTSFCLERWSIQGGGKSRESNHHLRLEKWLWRALWDVYVAFDINTMDWTCENTLRAPFSLFARSDKSYCVSTT